MSEKPKWLEGEPTPREVAEQVSGVVLYPPARFLRWWWPCFLLSSFGVLVMIVSIAVLLIRGVGVWGNNWPVMWGFAITNFVWWIGIGHAGTFISAFLLLMRQEWRTSINRLAETMTLFAVTCAGLFPLLHLGRPWYFYWLAPYPNRMSLWPQWRSPLIWDFFAVSTYLSVSILFWYLGLVPDLATMRDRSRKLWQRRLFAIFALGWRSSVRHWNTHQRAYLIMAGLATPLVISVHSIVALDFAVALVPGWHSTIFPPFFVIGALLSGFAMVLTLVVPLRKLLGLENLITMRHLDVLAKMTLLMSLLLSYGYLVEIFTAWYGNEHADLIVIHDRFTGAYAPVYYTLLFCNALSPLPLFSRRVRQMPWVLFGISLFVQLGMWSERFIIVIQCLSRDFTHSSWHRFIPTVWDWGLLFGTIALFFWGILVTIRLVPMLSISELSKLSVEEARE